MPDPDTAEEAPERAERPTLMDGLDFEPQVLQRLKEIRTEMIHVKDRLSSVEAIVEGRTKLLNRMFDGVGACFRATTAGMSVLIERFTKPSITFVALWAITLIGLTGLTAADVISVSGVFKGLLTEEVAPATVQPVEPGVEP
jgi:hypothetical protein